MTVSCFSASLPTDLLPTEKAEVLSGEVRGAFSLAHKPWIPHAD